MKHRSIRALFAALAVFLLGFGTVFDVSAASEFASGNGTASDPYVIETAAQLAYLSESVNGSGTYRSSHFVLVNDITLNDESFTFNSDTGLVRVSDGTNTAYLGTGIKGDNSKGNTVFDTVASEAGVWYKSDSSKTVGAYAGDLNSWTPIGNESKRFDGCFDGKGHTVSGLYVNIQGANGGLFGYASAELDNVRIKNSYVHAGELADPYILTCLPYKNARTARCREIWRWQVLWRFGFYLRPWGREAEGSRADGCGHLCPLSRFGYLSIYRLSPFPDRLSPLLAYSRFCH